jgi:mannose-6-phosphate isomerase-like protein (cupin superfamily)
MPQPLDLFTTHFDVIDGGANIALPVTPAFWSDLIEGRTRIHGRLLGATRLEPQATHWEIHPEGDELLYLLSGAVDIILEEPGGERVVTLGSRSGCVVPKGTWHRFVIHAASDLLFLTWGEGTTHRPYKGATS